MEKIVLAILFLTGASSLEELDESVVERFWYYTEHPVEMNASSRSRLLSSGLMSAYQVASLMEYRSRTGDVLSAMELSAVDGFGPQTADALRPFVAFSSSRPAGSPVVGKTSQTLMLRGSRRCDYANDAVGVKYTLDVSGRLELGWASRTSYSDSEFGLGTVNATWYGRGVLGKLVIGDFNARFGQGLLQWSGFSLSGYPTAASFARNGTGISASRSFSDGPRGIAADFNFGNWMASAAYSHDRQLMLNASYTSRTWQLGGTLVARPDVAGASVDWRVGFRGGAVFGEAAGVMSLPVAVGVPAAISARVLAGAFYVPAYGRKLAALARWSVDGGVVALAASSRWYDASVNATAKMADASSGTRLKSLAVKSILDMHPEWKVGALILKPSLRAVNKTTVTTSAPVVRTDIRPDLGLAVGGFQLNARFHAVWGRGFAWMGYAEAGWKSESSDLGSRLRGAVYARAGVFRVDDWDDRIYVYERDAPGNFNVPSFYGRGCAASLYATLTFGRHSLYLRLSDTEYPWTASKLPKREVKLQYNVKL